MRAPDISNQITSVPGLILIAHSVLPRMQKSSFQCSCFAESVRCNTVIGMRGIRGALCDVAKIIRPRGLHASLHFILKFKKNEYF